MTPRQKLKELLFPVGTIPDGLDVLLEDACKEITSLRQSSTLHATVAAAALKDKEAAFQREAFKQTELDQRNSTLSFMRKTVAEQDHEIMRLRAELVAKNEELARLRPAEPKFRVGQVVMTAKITPGFAVKLNKAMSLKPEYGQGWQYVDTINRWWQEVELRALTDEEK